MINTVKKRYRDAISSIPKPKFEPAAALRQSLREGYSKRDLRSDILAGIVVGIVALPLSMALAIAVGVPPQYGLYTAIVAGFVTALLGGSQTQVSGPTAAFVVILAPIVSQFGLGGLLVASVMAGVILIVMGLFRLGRLIEFIPNPVTSGFTAGIAVVIATFQIKDLMGLTVASWPDHYVEKLHVLGSALPTFHWPDFSIGVFTLLLLILWPRVTRKIPAPFVALSLAVAAMLALKHFVHGFDVATIGSRFSFMRDGHSVAGIPNLPPHPALPWLMPGPDGKPLVLNFALLHRLMPAAFAIAMLGAIESLLSAVVSDGMAGTRHDPDSELLAQGFANVASPFFGGFASTGAIARTATNIRAGGKSPISAAVHSIFVLAAVLLLGPWLAYLPMASLAALLLVVAWNMSDAKHFMHMVKVAPTSDVAVLLVCFLLTVFFDMVVAVSFGVVLAALLFMKRMAELTEGRLVEPGPLTSHREPLPSGVVLYEIAGALFFGAAQKAMNSLHDIGERGDIVIVNMGAVPSMDATGLVSLESALQSLEQGNAFVILVAVQKQPLSLLSQSGISADDQLAFCDTIEDAIKLSREVALRRETAKRIRST